MKKEKIYVKKIWSLNPTKFKKVEIHKALSLYVKYMKIYIETDFDIKDMKSFKEWLETGSIK